MSHTPAPEAWWHAPLVAPSVRANAWLAPWSAPDDYAALVEAFAQPELYHLACGLGEAPSPAYLRKVMSDPPDVHLWRLSASSPQSRRGVGPLVAHSVYTTLHQLAIWAGPGAELPEALWCAALAAAIDALFAHEPAASHVFVHLPVPTTVWQETFLLRSGFDPFEREAGPNSIRRELYGLTRDAHAQLRSGDEPA